MVTQGDQVAMLTLHSAQRDLPHQSGGAGRDPRHPGIPPGPLPPDSAGHERRARTPLAR